MVLESTYEWRGRADLWWYNKATDFRGAAAAISYVKQNDTKGVRELCNLGDGYHFFALSGPFRLMAGLSLELLLKAIIVLKYEGDFKSLPHIHDLNKLADAADVSSHLTDTQKDTLAIFSEAISWEGKYPVPKKEEQYDQNSKLWGKMMRPLTGQTGRFTITEANPDVWPNIENYNILWAIICGLYFALRETEGVDG